MADTLAVGTLAVGRGIPRLEAPAKLTGRAVYVDDIRRPGMLHAALLLAPHAHARIVSVDVSAALALPGVRCVLTGDDLPHRFGAFVKDETVLARGTVRYFGEPVGGRVEPLVEVRVPHDAGRIAVAELHVHRQHARASGHRGAQVASDDSAGSDASTVRAA